MLHFQKHPEPLELNQQPSGIQTTSKCGGSHPWQWHCHAMKLGWCDQPCMWNLPSPSSWPAVSAALESHPIQGEEPKSQQLQSTQMQGFLTGGYRHCSQCLQLSEWAKKALKSVGTKEDDEELPIWVVLLELSDAEIYIFDHNHDVDIGLTGHKICFGSTVSIEIEHHMCCGAQMDQLFIKIEINKNVGHVEILCKFTIKLQGLSCMTEHIICSFWSCQKWPYFLEKWVAKHDILLIVWV